MTEKDVALTIGELAEVIGQPLNKMKTMRHRGHWPCRDGAPYDDGYDAGWHRYDLVDAALTSAMLDMAENGIAASVAASILANNRGTVIGAKHSERPSDDDCWIGILRFEDGAAHVGGRYPEVIRDVTRKIKADIENFDDDRGGGTEIVLLNVSKHIRRVRRALKGRAN